MWSDMLNFLGQEELTNTIRKDEITVTVLSYTTIMVISKTWLCVVCAVCLLWSRRERISHVCVGVGNTSPSFIR